MARRDNVTMELPGIARRRGRPATGKAKPASVRQAAYRRRRQEEKADPAEFVLLVTKYPALLSLTADQIRAIRAIPVHLARDFYAGRLLALEFKA